MSAGPGTSNGTGIGAGTRTGFGTGTGSGTDTHVTRVKFLCRRPSMKCGFLAPWGGKAESGFTQRAEMKPMPFPPLLCPSPQIVGDVDF